MEISDKWCPSGVNFGTNVFINDIVALSESSKFSDDIKVCGVTDGREGHDAIQRDLDKIEK